MRKDRNGEVFSGRVNDLTCNGKCTQCGQCCSNLLPMTDDEIAIIHKYVKRYHIKEHRHNYPLLVLSDMTCPFLNDSKTCEKCEIYQVRPKICRDFICCSEKMLAPDIEHAFRCKITNVREEFFN